MRVAVVGSGVAGLVAGSELHREADDADETERRALATLPYRRNAVVLHTDARQLPRAASATGAAVPACMPSATASACSISTSTSCRRWTARSGSSRSTASTRSPSTLNPASDASRHAARYRAPKAMYVSPFLAREGYYDFHFAPVGPRLSVGLLQYERDRPTLDEQFWGRRTELTSRSVARMLATHPLAAVKTIAAIHGEALRLWLKRIPVHRRTPRGDGALALRVSVDDTAPEPAVPVPAAPVPPAAPAGTISEDASHAIRRHS